MLMMEKYLPILSNDLSASYIMAFLSISIVELFSVSFSFFFFQGFLLSICLFSAGFSLTILRFLALQKRSRQLNGTNSSVR